MKSRSLTTLDSACENSAPTHFHSTRVMSIPLLGSFPHRVAGSGRDLGGPHQLCTPSGEPVERNHKLQSLMC